LSVCPIEFYEVLGMTPIALGSLCVLACVADVAAHRSEGLEILQREVAEPHIADLMNSLVEKTDGEFLSLGGILNCKFRDDEDTVAEDYLSCQGPDDWIRTAGELLKVLATVAASTGPGGALAAVVLSLTATLVKMWEDDGGLGLHKDIFTTLEKNLEDFKDFHFQQQLQRAKERDIDLKALIADVRRMRWVSETCDPLIVKDWISGEKEAWPDMAAMLVAANATIKETSKDVGWDVLRRRVRLINGFKNLWMTMAMGRLELLTLVVNKSRDCPNFQQQAKNRLNHTLLTEAVGRFRDFTKAWEPVEADFLGHAEELRDRLDVAELRERLEYFWPWSKPRPETYANVSKELLKHGEPGRGVLKDLILRKAAPLDRKSAVIVSLRDQPSELLLPLAQTFMQVATRRPTAGQPIFPGVMAAGVMAARSIVLSLKKEYAEEIAAQGIRIPIRW